MYRTSERDQYESFRFDLSLLPFGRKDSLLAILYEKNGLYINRFTKDYPVQTHAATEFHPKAIQFWTGLSEKPTPVINKAYPDQVTLSDGKTSAAFCFDGKDALRFLGEGEGMTFIPGPTDGNATFVDLQDGTVLFSSLLEGEFLFVPLKGSLSLNGQRLSAIPEDGCFETAVLFGLCEPQPRERYRDFGSCADESWESYLAWYRQYPETDPEYEPLKKTAAYGVWICCTLLPNAPQGYIPLYCRFDSAFCWQGIYHALGVVNNPDTASYIMMSIFQYQDAHGQLADLVDDRNINYLSTKPPVQGLTFLNLYARLGEKWTAKHYEQMYEPFRRWYQWWMECRDTDRDGIPQYNQGCESAVDTSAMFAKGVPVECPDLIAYMALMAESLQVMAEKLNKPQEALHWRAESAWLVETLIREFWNGERFVARVSGSHEIVETDEVDVYTPIILGKRLPEDILVKLIRDLKDPEQYMTPIGFRHAPARAKDFMRGVVGGFVQIKFAIGLHDAGEITLAREILEKYCEINLRLGPSLGYHEKDVGKTFDPDKPGNRLGMYSALACGVYLAGIVLIREWTEEINRNGRV